MRLVIAFGVLACLLMTWSLGPALPAYADDPEQLPPSSPPHQVGLREIEFHQPRQDPDARLQIVLRSVKVLDDRDWGRGEFRFLLWFWRVHSACPPDAISEECNTTLLHSESARASAYDGQTMVFDQVIPNAGPVRPWTGSTHVYEPSIGPDVGIPVWADHAYGMAIAGQEVDTIINDDLGNLEMVIAAADNWRIGTWTERTKRKPEIDCGIITGCEFRASKCDVEVTYEVRLARLPDLTPMKIEKVTLAGTTNDGVCMDVGNVGSRDAGPFQVVLRIDDAPALNGILQAGGLPAGKIGTFCTETTLPTAGQHRLSMTVDELRQVLEQRETNNRGEQTLDLTQAGRTRPQGGPGGPGPVVADTGSGPDGAGSTPTPIPSSSPRPSPGQADLTVSAIRVNGRAPDGKDDCKDGRNDVTVVVKNVGKADTGAFVVQFQVDGASEQTAEKSVTGLEAGQEREVRFEDVRLKKGEHKLEAIADAEKTVAERDEANNARAVAAQCKDDD